MSNFRSVEQPSVRVATVVDGEEEVVNGDQGNVEAQTAEGGKTEVARRSLGTEMKPRLRLDSM